LYKSNSIHRVNTSTLTYIFLLDFPEISHSPSVRYNEMIVKQSNLVLHEYIG